MSSVISARRHWEGSISGWVLVVGEERISCRGLWLEMCCGVAGLMSARTAAGEMGSSMLDCKVEGAVGFLDVTAVARDISSTSNGRICFPSELV